MNEFSDALGESPQPEKKRKSRHRHSKPTNFEQPSEQLPNQAETHPLPESTHLGETLSEKSPETQQKVEFPNNSDTAPLDDFARDQPPRPPPPPLGTLTQTLGSPRNNSMHKSRRRSIGGVNGLGEVATYWYDVLTRYGAMEPDEATRVCLIFEKSNLPFPSPDADAYLTHDFLTDIGVSNPGDRCRILLACKRMPELRHRQRQQDDEVEQVANVEENEDRKRKLLLEASLFCGDEGVDAGMTSYQPDTTVVQLSRFQPKDGSFEWIDFIGKDVPDLDSEVGKSPSGKKEGVNSIGAKARQSGTFERRESNTIVSHHGDSSVGEQTPRTGHVALDIIHKERSKRRASSQPPENGTSTNLLPVPGSNATNSSDNFRPNSPSGNLSVSHKSEVLDTSPLDGSRWASAMREVFKATGEHDPNELLLSKDNPTSLDGMITISPAEDNDTQQKSTLLADLLATKLPLPQLRIDRTQPSKCCFVLRVCTLDVEDEDDTMRSLTNRWTIFVDAANKTVVTIHRVDSVALATLRDSWKQGIPGNISFNEFIVKLLERFLLEYEKALDASDEWLDSCEASMLSSTSGSNDDLLTNLFHLQRRASVYDRMVVLSRNLLQREVAKHLMLGDDLETLESRFQQLQEKTVELGGRAQNLLEIHLSLTGYHTNELMKLLTKVSMFFTPITFLAGLWGMNFETMPELKWEYGYWCALGLMICIALGMLGWFRYAKI